jgi:hypothetical protein
MDTCHAQPSRAEPSGSKAGLQIAKGGEGVSNPLGEKARTHPPA